MELTVTNRPMACPLSEGRGAKRPVDVCSAPTVVKRRPTRSVVDSLGPLNLFRCIKVCFVQYSVIKERYWRPESFGTGCARHIDFSMAQWLSWLERRPVTAEVVGSSPSWVGYIY